MLIDDFSYASEAHSMPRALLIRAIELMSGQPRLKRLYQAYQAERLPHSAFWQQAIDRLQLDIRLHGRPLADIPADGPLVIVANHP